MALFNGKKLIHLELADPIDLPARPSNFQYLDEVGLPKAEM